MIIVPGSHSPLADFDACQVHNLDNLPPNAAAPLSAPYLQHPYPLFVLPPFTTCRTSNLYVNFVHCYCSSPNSHPSTTSPRRRRRRRRTGYRRAGGLTVEVVQTASHASSSRQGASATAGPTSDFRHPISPEIQPPTLTVPEDAHGNIQSQNPQSASSNPRVPPPSFQPPYPSPVALPQSRRWSLRNAFSPLQPPPRLHPPQVYPGISSRGIIRPRPGGRLWNPTNSTPRTPRPRSPDPAAREVAVPLQHPQIGGETATVESGGAYPLLTLQEQRQSRHSGSATPRASLQVEYNSSASGSNRISLPRSVSLDIRRSTEVEGVKDKGKGKQVEVEDQGKATGSRRRLSGGPPVALKQQLEALERQEKRKKDKGKGKAREIDINMASPDLEPGVPHQAQTYDPSGRAVLPTNRSTTSLSQHSGVGPPLSSAGSSIHGSAHGVVLPGEDAEWGPSHPCYPHYNPHVPLSSPLYQSTRIIRIRRDWMLEGDLAPTFSGLYPEILADAGLGEGEFRRVVETVNRQLIPAFNPFSWRNILDAVLGLVTGWIWDDMGFTAVKSSLRKVEEGLEGWNREVEKETSGRIGARFIPLRRSGYMTLDIQIPTPQIEEANDEEDAHPGGAVAAEEGPA